MLFCNQGINDMRIKELRIEKGLLQKDIATALNKSTVCIGDWERGRTEPSIEDLFKLSDLFGVSIDYIVGREDDFGNIQLQSTSTDIDGEMIRKYRLLNEQEKTAVNTLINSFYKNK